MRYPLRQPAQSVTRQVVARPSTEFPRMAIEKGRASKASETPTLKVGDPAPDFTLASHTGEEFTLSAKRGTNVVVAFYPAAFTGT
jgi:hypothetical protein